MGTQASVKFSDNQGNFIANVYCSMDGHPDYLGRKLVNLTTSPITRGVTLKPDGTRPVLGEVFNGLGCLVASVIAKLKTHPGDVHIFTEGDYGESDENYLYEIIENSEGTGVEVFVMNQNDEWEFVSEILNRVDAM